MGGAVADRAAIRARACVEAAGRTAAKLRAKRPGARGLTGFERPLRDDVRGGWGRMQKTNFPFSYTRSRRRRQTRCRIFRLLMGGAKGVCGLCIVTPFPARESLQGGGLRYRLSLKSVAVGSLPVDWLAVADPAEQESRC
jgi:hypothetical protein